MRSVANPTRGCGTLRKGGCYARGVSGKSGILRGWTWLLGHMWDAPGAKNLTWEPRSDRAMQLINLPFSIHMQTIVQELNISKVDDPSPEWKLPMAALVDHVGSNHYTPWSFALEVMAYGPSRRIPPAAARQIAALTPIPIVFTHDWMPVVDEVAQPALQEWANGEGTSPGLGIAYSPTWLREGFGFTIRDEYDGSDHWILPVLQQMHEQSGGKVKPLEKFMPITLTEHIVTTEQALGVSWINEVILVTTGQETDEELEDFISNGIEPVTIDEAEE